MAAEKNMADAIIKFKNKGGDIDIRNSNGFSCLHIAAKEGYVDLVKHLIAMDANLEVRDEFGYSPSYWAH